MKTITEKYLQAMECGNVSAGMTSYETPATYDREAFFRNYEGQKPDLGLIGNDIKEMDEENEEMEESTNIMAEMEQLEREADELAEEDECTEEVENVEECNEGEEE